MTWMRFYYVSPTPDRFVSEVRDMAKETLGGPSAGVTAMFLGHVMRANPARIAGWFEELRDLEGVMRESLHIGAVIADLPEARAVLARSSEPELATASTPEVLDLELDDGAVLEVVWAYFFATGDPRAIRRIVGALDHPAVVRAASWSLAAIMKEHPPLRAICEAMLATLTPNERDALARVMRQ